MSLRPLGLVALPLAILLWFKVLGVVAGALAAVLFVILLAASPP